MKIELGELPDGDLVLVSDKTFPADVKRIEYYRDQRLCMLVYDDPEHELPSTVLCYDLLAQTRLEKPV